MPTTTDVEQRRLGRAGIAGHDGRARAGGIPYFGAGNNLAEARAPWVADVGGTTIAFLGIDGVTANEEARDFGATVYMSELGGSGYAGATDSTPGTNPYITEQFLADIEAAAGQYDYVIPYFHMGIEYFPVPPAWAREGAKAAIEAGATMVVTNHPHVIQGCRAIRANRSSIRSALHLRPDVLGRGAGRQHSGNRAAGWQGGRAASARSRDRGFQPAAAHDRRGARLADGSVLAKHRPHCRGGSGDSRASVLGATQSPALRSS
ncbi:MAG: CapA family protein [Thermomicrobiales bacterium]